MMTRLHPFHTSHSTGKKKKLQQISEDIEEIAEEDEEMDIGEFVDRNIMNNPSGNEGHRKEQAQGNINSSSGKPDEINPVRGSTSSQPNNSPKPPKLTSNLPKSNTASPKPPKLTSNLPKSNTASPKLGAAGSKSTAKTSTKSRRGSVPKKVVV